MKTNEVQWNKPELLVLTRSNPEEAVLGTCKNTTITGNGDPNGTTCAAHGGGTWCMDPATS